MTRAVGVIGGGTMGVGIAYVAAQAGGDVTVVEPSAERRQALDRTIEDAARNAVARGKLSESEAEALGERVRCVSAVAELAANLDVVIETVPERLELKLEVLAAASERRPRLLATNTSALSIDRLAQAVADPTTFLGMHFFNPVWSLKLVEIVRGERSSEAAVEHARDITAWLGKEALVVRDVPGFATSRLDLIAALEAMRMLESGVADAADIDRAAVLAYRHPVGPLRLSDIVGLDVRLDIARTLQAAHGDRYAPPPILERMVAEGRLGQKSGHGFFTWPEMHTGAPQ